MSLPHRPSSRAGSLALLGLAAFVANGGCATAVVDDNVLDDDALLNVATPRGVSTTTFALAGGAPEERCIVPQHIVGASYSDGDAKTESELCSYNFYAATPGKAVAVCPKLVSTNPGVDVQALLEGKDALATQSEICSKSDRPTKLLAKFKQSISCSYAPSILGYYHLSRALGGIGSVKPAVIRTMDLSEHKKVVAAGIQSSTDLIQTIWKQYQSSEANPAGSRYKDAIYTSDLRQIYGAMQENPRGEIKYADPLSGRSLNVRGPTDASSAFRATAAYRAVQDARPIRDWVPLTLAGSAQRVVQMRDISDMVLIDTLMAQQDRFGNIHAVDYYYYQEAGELKKVKKSKVDEGEKTLPPGAVVVREMLLKDNDCGVTKENVAKNAGMLQQLRHMSPKTYAHLRWLNASFGRGAAIPSFLVREALFTQKDLDRVRENIREAEGVLRSSCQSGQLKLDLDLDAHLAGTQPAAASCDASEPPTP